MLISGVSTHSLTCRVGANCSNDWTSVGLKVDVLQMFGCGFECIGLRMNLPKTCSPVTRFLIAIMELFHDLRAF